MKRLLSTMSEPEVAVDERLYPAPEHTPDADPGAMPSGKKRSQMSDDCDPADAG
jgi:hypothetical protein